MKPRVLVVDDDGSVRETIRRLLEAKGYRVDVAADAAEGVRKAREGRFEVILLDHMMPGRTGLEALPEMRQAAPGSAIVMLTAYGSVDLAKQAIRKGAADFLLKPIDPPALYRAVEHAAASCEESRPSRPGVLVVEDDPALANLLKALLEKEDYQVLVASTGEEALQRAREKPFDFLLVDVGLPDMGGLQVVERAFTYHETRPAAIVMATQPTVQDAVRATKMGAVEYLAKPIEPQALIDLLAKEAEKRRWRSLPEGLRLGQAYLVFEPSGERTRDLFHQITRRGLRGMAFCRDPSSLPHFHPGVRAIVLGELDPSVPHTADPVEVFAKVEAYCRQEPAAILIDGLEYLSGRAGFPRLLTVFQNLRELMATTGSLLLCPVDPQACGERELALLRKEFHVLDLQSSANRTEQWERTARNLPPDQKRLYDLLIGARGAMLQSDLALKCGFSRAKLTRVLDQLETNGLLQRRREGMGNRVLLT